MNNVGFCRRSKVDVNQSCFVVAPGDVALGPQPYATRIHYILPHNIPTANTHLSTIFSLLYSPLILNPDFYP